MHKWSWDDNKCDAFVCSAVLNYWQALVHTPGLLRGLQLSCPLPAPGHRDKALRDAARPEDFIRALHLLLNDLALGIRCDFGVQKLLMLLGGMHADFKRPFSSAVCCPERGAYEGGWRLEDAQECLSAIDLQLWNRVYANNGKAFPCQVCAIV